MIDKELLNSQEEQPESKPPESKPPEKKNPKIFFNIAVFIFCMVLTVAALVTFFIAVSIYGGHYVAYYIAGTYILTMLLGAPTLKVFLDKAAHKPLKNLNIAGLVIVFTAVLVVAIATAVVLILSI